MNQLIVRNIFLALVMGGTAALGFAAAPAVTEKDAGQEATQKEEENSSLIESAQVAKDYVDGVDKGEYDQSWSKSDTVFQNTIPQNEWKDFLTELRKRTGKVVSRRLKDQNPAWNPRGLPEGAYMVIIYNTSFQNLPNVEELLTLRKGPDKKWRVLTYEVKKDDTKGA